MAQRRFSIGTSPEIIANYNEKRASIAITMLPTAIESGNTGRVHIGKGFVPAPTVGAPVQGDIITQGTEITDVPQYKGDPSLFRGQWWAVASAASQVIVVDETTDDIPISQPTESE